MESKFWVVGTKWSTNLIKLRIAHWMDSDDLKFLGSWKKRASWSFRPLAKFCIPVHDCGIDSESPRIFRCGAYRLFSLCVTGFSFLSSLAPVTYQLGATGRQRTIFMVGRRAIRFRKFWLKTEDRSFLLEMRRGRGCQAVWGQSSSFAIWVAKRESWSLRKTSPDGKEKNSSLYSTPIDQPKDRSWSVH